MNEKPSANRSGCDWDEFNASGAVVLVKAPAKVTADSLGRIVFADARAIDVAEFEATNPDGYVVFQVLGQEWSIFLTGLEPATAKPLSAEFETTALSVMYEDVSGWSEYRRFDLGTNVETYTWGMDYSAETEAEIGEEIPGVPATDNGLKWDQIFRANGDQFRFRSTLRSVSKVVLADPRATLDDAFKVAGAWLPNWRQLPGGDGSPADRLPLDGLYVLKR